ncbi:MAG: hypothetical protein GX811_01230 [Lentisphaerae bacterium]|nr:hypothetical protein [Lentisphaerota bacterium]
MAAGYMFTCDSCGFSLEAWDEGNPYIEFPKGKRHYFYHPSEMKVIRAVTKSIIGYEPTDEECNDALKKYAGNESDYICRSCRKETKFDPKKDIHACTHCGSTDVDDIFTIAGKRCIKCDGTFLEGEFVAIS